MIEAIPEKPGWLSIVDTKGCRHVVSVFAMGKPQATGTSTVYLKFTSYQNLFVRCSLDEVRAAARRARTLREAEIATALRAQLELDLKKETATVQLPTKTVAQLAPPLDAGEVANGES
jgi:hypothetical protein